MTECNDKSKNSYVDKLKDSLTWWLGRRRPFIINDEYQIELIVIDRENYSAKIKVTNLKTGKEITSFAESFESAEVSNGSK